MGVIPPFLEDSHFPLFLEIIYPPQWIPLEMVSSCSALVLKLTSRNLHHGPNGRGSFVRTDSVLISSCFLEE